MKEKQSPFLAFFDTALGVGLVTFACGLLSAGVIYWSANPAARTLSISLLAALVTTNLVRSVNSARDEIKETVMDTGATDRLNREIEKPFLRFVGGKLLKNLHVALEQLGGGARNVFKHQGEYMNWAIARIDQLQKGDLILAVCGDKDWQDNSVISFTQKNCDAALRGVEVRRIFLQYKASGFVAGEKKVLIAHVEAKRKGGEIYPLVIPPRDANKIVKDYELPPGFGFTYIESKNSGTVSLVHWGLSGSTRDGLWFDSPLITHLFKQMHEEFRARAYEYDGTLLEPERS